jgi:hypothetical protein
MKMENKIESLKEKIEKLKESLVEAQKFDYLKKMIKHNKSATSYKDEIKHLLDNHYSLADFLKHKGFSGNLDKMLIDFYNKYKESLSSESLKMGEIIIKTF